MDSQEVSRVFHHRIRLESKSHPIFLRNVQHADAPDFARIVSHPSNNSDPNSAPVDTPTATRCIAEMVDDASIPTTYTSDDVKVVGGPGRINLLVMLKDEAHPEGLIIGLGGFGSIKTINVEETNWKDWRVGDVGVVIAPDHQRKGYATEAMRLAIEYGLASVKDGGLQLDRVTVRTMKMNVGMMKVMEEKLGLGGRGMEAPMGFKGKDVVEVDWSFSAEDWEAIAR